MVQLTTCCPRLAGNYNRQRGNAFEQAVGFAGCGTVILSAAYTRTKRLLTLLSASPGANLVIILNAELQSLHRQVPHAVIDRPTGSDFLRERGGERGRFSRCRLLTFTRILRPAHGAYSQA
jgi:hypothetical protein